ncbi:MAG: hypothetical protein RLZZ78_1379 [Armatimonadota bacterium]|jgi:hypothetical protein
MMSNNRPTLAVLRRVVNLIAFETRVLSCKKFIDQ